MMPQKAVISRGGFADPREQRMPMTTAPASAPLTNHSTISTITAMLMVPASGNWSSSAKSAEAWLASTASTMPIALGQREVDRGTAEDHEPDHADGRRQQQHAQHELADRPSLGDAGDEGADERRPRDPPRPVEDGPALHPLSWLNVPVRSIIGQKL